MTRDRRLDMALDDAALEAALFDLSAAIVVPPAPDVAAAVGARLRAPRPQRLQRTAAPRFRLRWALLAALLGLLLLAAIAAATGFELPGLRILFAEPTASPSISVAPSGPAVSASAAQASAVPGSAAPGSAAPASAAPGSGAPGSAAPASAGSAASPTLRRTTPSPTTAASPAPTLPGPSLGLSTTLDAARATVLFRLFLPEPSVVDQSMPSVYIDSSIPQGQVVLIYAATPGLPASSTSPVGPGGRPTALLITESRGSFDEGFLQKTLGPDATVTAVDVSGARGFWITGAHEILVIDASGDVRPNTLRDVGDVLVFVREGTLVRIESGLGLDRTLEIARSMR
jgi:hypothetical protein